MSTTTASTSSGETKEAGTRKEGITSQHMPDRDMVLLGWYVSNLSNPYGGTCSQPVDLLEPVPPQANVVPADMSKTHVVNQILSLAFETSAGLFATIFAFLDTTGEYERFLFRCICKTFHFVLKPTPLWTCFPQPKYLQLNDLIDKLNSVYKQDPKKAPTVVFIKTGTFHADAVPYCDGMDSVDVAIEYPVAIEGAGQNKTFLSGYRFDIKGSKEGRKRVELKDMTISSGTFDTGLSAGSGLSFLCDSITFYQCGSNGVGVGQGLYYGARRSKTKGRLINCVITQCGGCGIYCSSNALIELEGSQTKIDGNVKDEYWADNGLQTFDSSSDIHLLFPLTKESVSTNNHNDQNYGSAGGGSIDTVNSFD